MHVFFVVDVRGPAVLGLPSCKNLHIDTLHCSMSSNQPPVYSNVKDLLDVYPPQYDRIGKFHTTHRLVVDPNIPPHVDSPHRTPTALKAKIQSELDDIV